VSTFNHVGHCVRDLERSRRFYVEALGFEPWYDLTLDDQPTGQLLRLKEPVGLQCIYLRRDGFVLELMEFAAPGAQADGRERVMNEPGLTHISLAVADYEGTLARVGDYGGEVLLDTKNNMVAFIRDPDGQLIELGTMGWRDALPPLPPLP